MQNLHLHLFCTWKAQTHINTLTYCFPFRYHLSYTINQIFTRLHFFSKFHFHFQIARLFSTHEHNTYTYIDIHTSIYIGIYSEKAPANPTINCLHPHVRVQTNTHTLNIFLSSFIFVVTIIIHYRCYFKICSEFNFVVLLHILTLLFIDLVSKYIAKIYFILL